MRRARAEGAGAGDGHGWGYMSPSSGACRDSGYRSDIRLERFCTRWVKGRRVYRRFATETMNAILKSEWGRLTRRRITASQGNAPMCGSASRKIVRIGYSQREIWDLRGGAIGNGNAGTAMRGVAPCGDSYESARTRGLGVKDAAGVWGRRSVDGWSVFQRPARGRAIGVAMRRREK